MKLTEKQTDRIHSLASERGGLKPSDIVEDAKDKRSPLHALFVWDVKKAAQQQWLHVAREIIGSVTLVVQTNECIIKTPAYVRDPEAKGEGYRSIVALQGDPVNARESLVYTLGVASGHLKRAYDLAQPLGLAAEVDQLVQQITGLQRIVRTAA